MMGLIIWFRSNCLTIISLHELSVLRPVMPMLFMSVSRGRGWHEHVACGMLVAALVGGCAWVGRKADRRTGQLRSTVVATRWVSGGDDGARPRVIGEGAWSSEFGEVIGQIKP